MTDWSDDALRRAYAAARQRRAARRDVAPPAPEALAALVDGSIDPSQREALLEQALEAGDGDALTLLHVVSDAAARVHAPDAGHSAHPDDLAARREAPRPAARSRWATARWPLAAAAALVVAIGIPTWQRSQHRDEPPVFRAGPDAAGAITLLAPEASAPITPDTRFVWRAVPGASSYVLEWLDDAGTVQRQRETTDTTTRLADTAAATPLASATGWWVRARMADGGERRSELRLLGPQRP